MQEAIYGISFTVAEGSIHMPSYCYARYNRVENMKAHGAISSHNGAYMYFQDNYVKNFGANGICNQGSDLYGLT